MQEDTRKIIEDQFNVLPKVVQEAILSGHVEEKFLVLAKKHRLHLDEWQKVENYIMLTVLGLSQPEQLVDVIVNGTNMGRERAAAIVDDVAKTVFKPIREELERQLGHPLAREEEVSDVEQVREKVLGQSNERSDAIQLGQQAAPAALLPTPATPPAPPPEEKVTRAPASGAYKPGEASTTRKDVVDDPYREPPA